MQIFVVPPKISSLTIPSASRSRWTSIPSNVSSTKAVTALNKRYAKFVALAGNGPVPQGIDPLLSKIAQASTEMVPLKERELAHTVDWLSREIDHGDTAKDVVYLLSKLQPDLDFRTTDQVVIDADKLNSHARQALTLYVKAHMT
jgi:hypothetical protein